MQPAQTRFGRLNLRHQIGGFAFLARERSCISIIAEEEGGAAIIRLTHGVYQANRSASSAPMVRHGVRRQPSERTVKVVDVTDLCLNKQHVVNPIGQLSRLQPGQMISVKMRKGTEVAEGINDQGYEVINRLSSPTSGSSSGPAFPACD